VIRPGVPVPALRWCAQTVGQIRGSRTSDACGVKETLVAVAVGSWLQTMPSIDLTGERSERGRDGIVWRISPDGAGERFADVGGRPLG
jgi:hypothetical protein